MSDAHCVCSGSPGDPDFTPAAACGVHGKSYEQAQLERRKRDREERYQRALEACPSGILGTIMLAINREVEAETAELHAHHDAFVEASRELHEAKVAALTAERDATLAELERWRHGVPIEGDYVCPDSLEVAHLRKLLRATRAYVYRASCFDGEERLERERLTRAINEVLKIDATPPPIPMLMFCPRCGVQHIDEPKGEWTNPPHKTHTCQACGARWRHCDAWPTTGVASLADPGRDVVDPAPGSQDAEAIARWLDRVNDTEHTPRGYAAGYFAARIRVGDWKP